MKKILLMILLLVPTLSLSSTKIELNYPFPELKITTIDKNVVNPIPKNGKALVSFWASWCAPCVTEVKNFVHLKDEMKKQGIELILINVDRNPKAINKFFKKHNLPMDTLTYRGNLYEALREFKASGLPITVAVKDEVVIDQYLYLNMPWGDKELINNISSPFDK